MHGSIHALSAVPLLPTLPGSTLPCPHPFPPPQLPQRCKASDIVVEGVDYDPHDLYSDTDSTSSSSSSSSSSPGSSASQSAAAAGDDDDSSSRAAPWCERFPALHASIAAAIAALGGAVAPRLNWSSPSDALWLSSSNSLRCTHPDEVR